MKNYFVNKQAAVNLIYDAISGKYGFYAKIGAYLNKSERAMEKDGYSLVKLTNEEAVKLFAKQARREKKLERQYFLQKMTERAAQIDICLKNEPLPIVPNEGGNPFVSAVVNLSNTPFISAYKGCGKGTAYISDGKLIAFHYGYQQPTNAPKCEAQRVELSCTQICL